MTTELVTAFQQLALPDAILTALDSVGYETPSPIQAQTIPLLLDGRDVLGQAQTGTGKTAAFALPALANIDLKQKDPQVLVLAPTRELAIQVSEAFQKYAANMRGFHVLPIYGGQDYRTQIRALKRGVHVVVGTPGRVMDHMEKGTLTLSNVKTLVLDEADEMLRMGFIEDVEWILKQTPEQRQIALFSATMPKQIKRIATQYLNDPAEVVIKVKTATADTIRQRFIIVNRTGKLDALTRSLEVESFDAMIIFVRTKIATVELSEKLEARGYAAAALNGDIAQNQRERTVDNLKRGKIDIIVATDVAARGLDVERISHVVNYDIPHDTEAYVHRIGRTGRAGREGDAILFVAPREKRMLSMIEKATKSKIEPMPIPSSQTVNDQRILRFKQRITETLNDADISLFKRLVKEYATETETELDDIAAALAHALNKDGPFLLPKEQPQKRQRAEDRFERSDDKRDRRPKREKERGEKTKRAKRSDFAKPEEGMERYWLAVGHDHKVSPGNIVGAIANEAGLDSEHIGRIQINDDHSLVDLPEGMPRDIFKTLKKVWVSGQQLKIRKANAGTKSKVAEKVNEKPKSKVKPKKKAAPKKAKKKTSKKSA